MRFRMRRIHTTIALASTMIALGTALSIATLSFSFTERAVRRSSRDYTIQLIDQLQSTIDAYVGHMENIAAVVQVNEAVQRYLTGEENGERAVAFLASISATREDVSLILVMGRDGRVIAHDAAFELNPYTDVTEREWYRRAYSVPGRPVISPSHVQNVERGVYRWVITLSRTVNDPRTGHPIGVMLVDLNFSVIDRLIHRISLGERGYVFIVNPDGRIIYHPRLELIHGKIEHEYIERVINDTAGEFVIDDAKGERVYTVDRSARTGWRVVGVNYLADMVRDRAVIRRTYVYWTIGAIAAAVIVSIIVSLRLTLPIRRLRASMHAVKRGNFDVACEVVSANEIGELSRDFNIMVAKIRELVATIKVEQEQKRKSELMALQNQITPHFLYNTLDSIIWMAEAGHYDNVITTVAALGRLLRLSISHGEELITIQGEVEHIKSYLTIQKVRYRDTLDYQVAVEGAIVGWKMPKVILQPLVENAIYHGIKNKVAGGTVTITGERRGDGVVFTVRDDGVGIDERRMRALLAGEEVYKRRSFGRLARGRPCVGVRNVHERIQLSFGRRYGLSFARAEAGGTVVTITLPILKPEEERDEDGA